VATINPLNAELNLIYHLLTLLGAHHILHVSRLRVKSEMASLLKGLGEEEFQGCFQQWKRSWDKCIVSNGEYFEGDHTDVS